jgi:hypothetical protein
MLKELMLLLFTQSLYFAIDKIFYIQALFLQALILRAQKQNSVFSNHVLNNLKMQYAVSIFLGLGLSAGSGFRVFIPLLITNVASQLGYVHLGSGFDWMGSWPAFAVFATATITEIAAYYIPWLDNLFDTIGTPLAVIAGTILTSSFITGMDPMLRWVLAIIAGGGMAGIIKAGTAVIRLGSTAVTGGIGNSILATLENIVSVLFSIAAVFIPVLAGICGIIAAVFSLYKVLRRKSRKKKADNA